MLLNVKLITLQSRDVTFLTFLSLNLFLLDKVQSRRKDLVPFV